MGGGGSKTQTVESKSEPWKGAQPYVTQGLNRANQWWNTGAPQIYPGNTVAPFNPDQILAQNLSTQRALQGNSQMNTAGVNMLDTLGGKYLGGAGVNPILQAGIAGASPHLGKYSDVATNRAGTDINALIYDQERQNMANAVNQAPLYAGQEVQDIGTLLGVGSDKQQYAQQLLDMYANKYNDTQALQKQRVNDYLALAYGAGKAGGTSTGSQPVYGPNPLVSTLGGGMTGALSGATLASLMGAGGGAGAGAAAGASATAGLGPYALIGGLLGAGLGYLGSR